MEAGVRRCLSGSFGRSGTVPGGGSCQLEFHACQLFEISGAIGVLVAVFAYQVVDRIPQIVKV